MSCWECASTVKKSVGSEDFFVLDVLGRNTFHVTVKTYQAALASMLLEVELSLLEGPTLKSRPLL